MSPNMANENPFIPSAREWKAGDNNEKRNILAYSFGALGLLLGIVPLLMLLFEPKPQPPAASAYELTQARRAEFLELLTVPPGAKLDTLRIGCTIWSEESCIAAGEFLKLFSEAGWAIDGAQVYRMEPSVPEGGVSIVSRSSKLDNLPEVPPHLGRWATISTSAWMIEMAFLYQDSPPKYSRDLSLGEHMLGVYFGPNVAVTPRLSAEQKRTLRPLMSLLKTGLTIESYRGRWNGEFCRAYQHFWEASVAHYLSSSFSPAARTEWLAISSAPGNFAGKMERQHNFLINAFHGLANFQQIPPI
ncbi:hypothetical protein [Pseudomonas aeruginosa]|uniref:hypothetical protein n=2 Tax=Pseudomonas aeruginosa TaxID=287 RepID=UPI000BB85F79|nr:hypothetical protein [Pseudomonas aeruginosa]MBH4518281.1 hypothetical protein [Pseudomonas aeruginosa]MBX6661982.1 hypothetical protein [Pseudomonas aeruginosa]MCB5967560.1 hypothetical protein [Pseudomonas aeruginosa]MDT1049886.1 hypothetical protein [Pseudomonas aeruginosa]PBV51121.1 hypothetical protein CJU28_15045 [Pseudomonas aeruginosa]